VLSDIHGNVVALEAALADAEQLGVDAYWVLGDLVAHGPRPAETLQRIRTLRGLVAVRGNTDRYVLTRPPRPEAEKSMTWTRNRLLEAGHLAWLAALPLERVVAGPSGTTVLLVHASPGQDDGAGLDPDASDEELVSRGFTESAGELILVGHTHLAADRRLAGAWVVNPGPVSLPRESDDRARWALLTLSADVWTVQHRAVRYDLAAVLTDLEVVAHPAGDWLRTKLTTPWG
jgi:predicted phosphodiesterase